MDNRSDTTTYRGIEGREVYVEPGPQIGVGEPLRHVARHSPTGFAWGYGGSGPADLARSILIDALGEVALCPSCAGTKLVAFDAHSGEDVPANRDVHAPDEIVRCRCVDGYDPALPYQAFKQQVVSRWDHQTFSITRGEVRRWYDTHRGERA